MTKEEFKLNMRAFLDDPEGDLENFVEEGRRMMPEFREHDEELCEHMKRVIGSLTDLVSYVKMRCELPQ